MFSFLKNYAATIDSIDVYPMAALFLFLTVFVGMSALALIADKKYISEIENLPLD
jgi:cytochrome c oxidase cbb3-type subunit 4